MPWLRRKMANYNGSGAGFRGGNRKATASGRREAPVERKEPLGHGPETEPLRAFARQTSHLASRGNFQASEPVGEFIDGESVYDIAVYTLIDQFGRAALWRGDDRQAAGHRLERRIRKGIVQARQREGVGCAVPGTHVFLGARKVNAGCDPARARQALGARLRLIPTHDDKMRVMLPGAGERFDQAKHALPFESRADMQVHGHVLRNTEFLTHRRSMRLAQPRMERFQIASV